MVSHLYAGFNKRKKSKKNETLLNDSRARECRALWKVTLNSTFLGWWFQWDISHTAASECLTPTPLSTHF